jgi:transcriptional regulator with PAS, ATPase and Fis domain
MPRDERPAPGPPIQIEAKHPAPVVASFAGSAPDRADPVAAPFTIELPDVRILIADPAMRRIYALIEQIAAVDLPVLLGGETGTGKELAAAAVHHWSRRCDRPFVAMNCAALPEGLVESELFGATKGAYSGAITKPGIFEEAHGGTIFLDEIGELPLGAQAKLLRVLETRRVRRVGAVKEREVELRVVAASHRDLEDEVRRGRFREDLYFRVSAATVRLPPLRARPCEIPLLAQELLDRACRQFRRGGLTLSAAAIDALVAYRWPGNVRELKNVVEYAAATARSSTICRADLPERVQPEGGASYDRVPDDRGGAAPATAAASDARELDKHRILAALDACNGNQTRAAQLLQMSRRTFVDKIRRYGLTQRRMYR